MCIDLFEVFILRSILNFPSKTLTSLKCSIFSVTFILLYFKIYFKSMIIAAYFSKFVFSFFCYLKYTFNQNAQNSKNKGVRDANVIKEFSSYSIIGRGEKICIKF